MKKIIILCTLFLLTGKFSSAQNNDASENQDISTLSDSLKVIHYYGLFIDKLKDDPKASKVFLDSVIAIANKSQDIYLEEKMYNGLGFYYTVTREAKNAEEALERLIEIRKELNDTLNLKRAYVNISKIQIRLGKYELGIESLLTALRLSEALGFTPKEKISIYFGLVKLHGKMSNVEQSNHYNGLVEKIAIDTKNKSLLATVWNNYAINYRKIEDYPNALIYLKKNIAYYESDKKYANRLARVYNNIGIVYKTTDSLNEAKYYFTKAEQIGPDLKDKTQTSVTLAYLGEIYKEFGEYNKAISYLERSKKIALKTENPSAISTSYYKLSETYAKIENYKKAYEYNILYWEIIDETKNQETVDKINELELKYQTEKKEQQIIIQKNEIDLLNVKGKVNNLQRLLLGLGLLLALIGVYALFQRNKHNEIAKEKAQSELEFKTKELTTHALHLAKKNEVLNDLKQKAKALKADANADPGYQMLIQTINFDLQDDNNWENFSRYFEEVHKGFNTTAQQKYPSITANDLRFMALLKMNLTSKEIANILNISHDGIKKARQRIRKKLGINSTESLEALVISI